MWRRVIALGVGKCVKGQRRCSIVRGHGRRHFRRSTGGATPSVLTAAAATGAEESTLELIGNTNVPVVLNGALSELAKAQCDSWRSPWRQEYCLQELDEACLVPGVRYARAVCFTGRRLIYTVSDCTMCADKI